MKNTHYSRWLTVHLFDLLTLPNTNPDLYQEFQENDNFVLQISKTNFSKIHPDQPHEQTKRIKVHLWYN